MRTNTLKRSYMSNERVLALDELLPDRNNNYDSSPGVYVRSDRDRELDILWQGTRVNAREEKSPVFYLSTGFVAGIVSVFLITAFLNFGKASDDSVVAWQKAHEKDAAVTVSPSFTDEAAALYSTTEYRVKSGDTLEAIAYRFYGSGTPSRINKIQVANNLRNPNALQIGQNLIIPVEN